LATSVGAHGLASQQSATKIRKEKKKKRKKVSTR